MKNIFKINCEWDMGFSEIYSTRENAQYAIDTADWEGLCDMTLEEVINAGYVAIEKVEVK